MPTRKHFVTFLSPGTFFDEETTQPVEGWDPAVVVALAEKITERYGAKPYAFYFKTSIVADPVSDGEGGTLKVSSKQVARSGRFYLGGTVLSYDDVVARNDPSESNLRFNMRHDRPFVCETRNSYRHIGEFAENDVVVNARGEITERGDTPERVAYRKAREMASQDDGA